MSMQIWLKNLSNHFNILSRYWSVQLDFLVKKLSVERNWLIEIELYYCEILSNL